MCEPVAILMGVGTAIQAGSAAIQHAEQARASEANEASARESARQSIGLLSLRQQQEAQAGAQTLFQMDLEARRAAAQANLMAGEAGVAGTSVDILLADIERQRLQAKKGTEDNLKGTVAQLEQEKKVVAANAQNQVNAVPAPNPWATGLRIGGAAAEGAAGYARMRAQGTGGSLGSVARQG